MSINAFALTPDQEKELADMIREATEVLDRGGVKYEPDKVREMMTKRLAEAKGWKLEPEAEAKPAKPEPPKVTVETGEKELSTKVVEKATEVEPYWYEDPKDTRFFTHYINLVQAGVVGALLVTGPSGQGKTEGLRRLAQKVGIPFYKMDCAAVTTEEKWIGRMAIDEKGTKFVMSEHLKWLEGLEYEPGMVCYDEINRIHPSKVNVLMSVLDGSRSLFVPDAGRYVIVHPKTVLVGTINEGAEYGGTFQMDRAFRRRWNFTVERGFPPASEEIKVITTRTGCPDDKAKLLVDIATQTRRKWEAGELRFPIDTGTLISAGYLAASGMSVAQSFEYTILPSYRPDGGATSERAMVKLIITGKSA